MGPGKPKALLRDPIQLKFYLKSDPPILGGPVMVVRHGYHILKCLMNNRYITSSYQEISDPLFWITYQTKLRLKFDEVGSGNIKVLFDEYMDFKIPPFNLVIHFCE